MIPLGLLGASTPRSGGGDSDPLWANVTSLLQFNGADGSTTITDERGVPWTVVGSAAIDDADSMFGGSSLYLPADGDEITTPPNTAFGFGTGDFTLELFVKTGNVAGETILFDTRASASTAASFFITSSRKLAVWQGSLLGGTGPGVPNSAWTHIAFSRVSSNLMAFVGGVLQWSVPGYNTSLGTSKPCVIGGSGFGSSDGVRGWIDEVRVTKGVGRYASNFTPPDAPFPRG